MTKRLYFDDAWARTFEARVLDSKTDGRGAWLCLDQTAFYPEGGGQPWDTGRLSLDGTAFEVLEVQSDESGRVWHLLKPGAECAVPGTGARISGEIDWERRFDHMQQHTGEHIIAGCLYELTGGFTHGLHIGRAESSIDVSFDDGRTRLDGETLDAIEALANRRIAEDGEVSCAFPGEEALKTLPLRKAPTVTQGVRVCAIGGYEMVACGGTHLSRTSQAGLVKLLRAEPARGKMRLFFLCGQRAARHYALVYGSLSQAAELLSAREEEVPQKLRDTLKQLEAARRGLMALRRQNLLARVPQLLEDATPLGDGRRLVTAELEGEDLPLMEALAGALVSRPGVIALLCVPREGRFNLLFARSGDAKENMSDFLKSTGAKGGGRPDFARGASNDSLPWEAAKVMAAHF